MTDKEIESTGWTLYDPDRKQISPYHYLYTARLGKWYINRTKYNPDRYYIVDNVSKHVMLFTLHNIGDLKQAMRLLEINTKLS